VPKKRPLNLPTTSFRQSLSDQSPNVSLYPDEQATNFASWQPILVVAAIRGDRVRNLRIFQFELVAIEFAMNGIGLQSTAVGTRYL
jgi:hypothetical protein